jgi:hypothetical protein
VPLPSGVLDLFTWSRPGSPGRLFFAGEPLGRPHPHTRWLIQINDRRKTFVVVRHMLRFLLSITLAVALASSAEASNYAIAGGGLSSCAAWTAARRDRRAIGFEEWVTGFLSGFGDIAASVPIPEMDPLRGLNTQTVWAWVDDYCHAHPLEKIVDAAEALARERANRPPSVNP